MSDVTLSSDLDLTRSVHSPDLNVSRRIGRYELVDKVGEGGMGEVWIAKQSEPVKRKVALKLIKQGMDSKNVIARFDQERQALAVMDHPNIAKVLDGGIAENGQPFFVMELVDGEPLAKFCDEAKLPIKARLQLFIPICQAVQHAHQKGVIHRDLKPSNILVSMIDGKPVPKVIDFGLAKAVTGKLTDETLSTNVGAVLGTLEYMAPEQAGVRAGDIDTRADVYSLGVILFELLTGLRPFDLRQAAFDEVLRVIREMDPPSLASRLSTDASLSNTAAVRQIEPRRLVSSLKGELDWIVQRCLEKDRNRRYESASGLARDVERFLEDEPVEARPLGAGYRVRKFLHRHRGPVVAAGLVLLALVGGVVGTTWKWLEANAAKREARDEAAKAVRNEKIAFERLVLLEEEQKRTLTERDRAERNEKVAVAEREIAVEVRRFLQDDLLKQGNPWQRVKAEKGVSAVNPTIRELLDRAASRLTDPELAERFKTKPKVYTEILTTVADAYQSLGDYSRAIALVKAALVVAQSQAPPDERVLGDLRCRLIAANYRAGRLPDFAAAAAVHCEALARNVSATDEAPFKLGVEQLDRTFAVAQDLFMDMPNFKSVELSALQKAAMLPSLTRVQLSLQSVRESIEARLGSDDRRVYVLRCILALAKELLGFRKEAIAEIERSLAGIERTYEPDALMTMFPNINLARLFAETDPAKSAAHTQRVLDVLTRRLPPNHPHIASAKMTLADSLVRQKRLPEAIKEMEDALRLRREVLGDHLNTMETMWTLSGAYMDARRWNDAVEFTRQCLAWAEKTLPPNDAKTIEVRHRLADVLERAGKDDESIALYEKVLEQRLKANPPDVVLTHATMYNLALGYDKKGRYKDAIALLEKVRVNDVDRLGVDHDETRETLYRLARAHLADKRPAEAVKLYEQIRDSQKRVAPKDPDDAAANDRRLGGAIDKLVEQLQQENKPDEVAKWKSERTKYPPAKTKSPPVKAPAKK